MKTIVHVNQHKIRAHSPKPLTVKTYKENREAQEVEILGPCKVVYRPDHPLSCGARVWIETQSEVLILGGEPGDVEKEEVGKRARVSMARVQRKDPICSVGMPGPLVQDSKGSSEKDLGDVRARSRSKGRASVKSIPSSRKRRTKLDR